MQKSFPAFGSSTDDTSVCFNLATVLTYLCAQCVIARRETGGGAPTVAFCFSWRSERPLETFSSVASLFDSCNTFSTTLKNTRAQQTVQYSTNANDPPQALHSKTYALATEHARRLVLAALSLTLLVARLAPLSRSAACSKQPTVLR